MAEQGELQRGIEHGRGPGQGRRLFPPARHRQHQPESGGGGAGAALGGILGHFGGWASTVGAIAGGINVKKGEANVTLSLVNARTTEEEALTEGYSRKTDISWGVGGGARLVGRLRGGGRLRLPEHRDRPGHRARLSRRLQEAGDAARRHIADSPRAAAAPLVE